MVLLAEFLLELPEVPPFVESAMPDEVAVGVVSVPLALAELTAEAAAVGL